MRVIMLQNHTTLIINNIKWRNFPKLTFQTHFQPTLARVYKFACT